MAFERIDGAFVLTHGEFRSWKCVRFGFDRKWIGVPIVAAIADSFLRSDVDEAELLLAFDLLRLRESEDDETKGLLSKLCALESQGADVGVECWRLWLLIGLLWLCEHQRFLRDPLSFAEELVDDVAFALERRPGDAVAWLRYMPVDPAEWNPTLHSREQNYSRLMDKWKSFLKQHAREHLKDFEQILASCTAPPEAQVS